MSRILRLGKRRAACTCPRCTASNLSHREWRKLSLSVAAIALTATAIAVDLLK